MRRPAGASHWNSRSRSTGLLDQTSAASPRSRNSSAAANPGSGGIRNSGAPGASGATRSARAVLLGIAPARVVQLGFEPVEMEIQQLADAHVAERLAEHPLGKDRIQKAV